MHGDPPPPVSSIQQPNLHLLPHQTIVILVFILMTLGLDYFHGFDSPNRFGIKAAIKLHADKNRNCRYKRQ
ncbi:hypothetical protein PMJEKBHI_02067 [Lacticaseibacillus rhamnosus]|nr:hypothetical protein LR1_19150 [Lacticaseibacillus rhamnosus DSM 20021 = JCM 1136 = NBRC 3425]SSA29137.1 hypothetical protein PMJEKBHI_02067 [Lacticaseibacillus rhamnosus]